MQWINVEDKIPEDSEEEISVLFLSRVAIDYSMIFSGYFFEGKWHAYAGGDCMLIHPKENVTHWMELPDYPEINNENSGVDSETQTSTDSS